MSLTEVSPLVGTVTHFQNVHTSSEFNSFVVLPLTSNVTPTPTATITPSSTPTQTFTPVTTSTPTITPSATPITITPTPTVTVNAAVPNSPSSLAAVSLSKTKIKLTWKDNSVDENGFKIERSVNGKPFVQIGTVGVNTSSFSDNSTQRKNAYRYRVRAYNQFGNSSYSNEASITANSTAALSYLSVEKKGKARTRRHSNL